MPRRTEYLFILVTILFFHVLLRYVLASDTRLCASTPLPIQLSNRSNPSRRQRNNPKARFNTEMQPSIPARNACAILNQLLFSFFSSLSLRAPFFGTHTFLTPIWRARST